MDRRRRNVIIQTVVAILPTVAIYSNEQIVLVGSFGLSADVCGP